MSQEVVTRALEKSRDWGQMGLWGWGRLPACTVVKAGLAAR